MSIVNTETGEIVDFDQAAAERRAQQIETRLTAVGESFTIAMQKIREAIDHRDDMALGYRSPGDYVSDRFGNALSGLPVEMRREAVRELTEAGLSSRAQAPAFNVSDRMIRKDQAATNTGGNLVPTSRTPAPDDLGEGESGAGQVPEGEGDGASGADDQAPTEATFGDNRPQDHPEAPAPATRPPVVGIDGKTYAPPKATPPKPSRSPEQVNAEENSQHLARSLIFLLAFQHPNMRDHARGEWEAGRFAVSPTNRGYVTPNHMREAASGLAALADEWESQ